MNEHFEERQATQRRYQRYREQAAAKYGVKVDGTAHVHETIQKDGAFVEIVVWVPRTEVELADALRD